MMVVGVAHCRTDIVTVLNHNVVMAPYRRDMVLVSSTRWWWLWPPEGGTQCLILSTRWWWWPPAGHCDVLNYEMVLAIPCIMDIGHEAFLFSTT